MTGAWARWVVWLAAVASVAATVSLGRWQLRRADAKQAVQALIEQRAGLPAWRNADWPCHATAQALPVQRPVRLHGRWMTSHTVYLDNRSMDGRTGFDVITPLVLDADPASSCPGAVVLVQRGWLPRHASDRLRLPPLPPSPAHVDVQGRLIAEPSRAYQLGQEGPPVGPIPLVRQNADHAFWQAWLGVRVLPGAVLQLQADLPLDGGTSNAVSTAMTASQPEAASPALLRQWTAPDTGQGKNLAYAAQWFAMAAVIAGLTVWYQLIRPRRAALPHEQP